MDNENGKYKYIYNNMQMFLFTCSMLYMPLNRVLTTLNGNHVIMKIGVRKHLSILINISIWYGVRIYMTVYILNYFYQFLIKTQITCFIHRPSNHMDKPLRVFPMITVSYGFRVNVLWLCLPSVHCIICLWFNRLFLVYGDVFTCISPCGQASHILTRKDVTHSIDNINSVAKCFTNPYPICKHEQNTIVLYIKIMNQLKGVAYKVRHNARNRYNLTSIILFMYNLFTNFINILLIAIKFSNKKRGLKVITVNEKLYTIPLYMYMLDSYVQLKTWWGHIDVGYNKYIHTLFNVRIYGVITKSEYSNFDKHFIIIYLLICITFILLYSSVKTLYLVIFIFILPCNACIDPNYEKFRLSLEKSSSTLKCNSYITKDYTFYPTNNQIILCPVSGMNHHKYDTKDHPNTERKITADEDDQILSNNTNDSSLNRTDISALSNVDPDINYLNYNMAYTNTWYFDDQHFKDKFKSYKKISMVHLNIRSIPEHFIELTSFIDSLDFVFQIIAISETWLKPYHTDFIIPNYSIEKDIRVHKRGGGVSLYVHSGLQYKLRNDFKIGSDSETTNSIFVEIDKNTAGTRQILIIGCIYHPPWVNLSEYNSCMTNTLALLQSEHKYTLCVI